MSAPPGSPDAAQAARRDPVTLQKVHLALTVNGEAQEVAFAPHKTLLELLREDLGLTGTKHGCELGECGTCTVLLDGVPVLSCLVLGLECEQAHIETVEGLATAAGPHPLQIAFADLGAAQCGYCTPGFLMTAKAMLEDDPAPTRETLKQELAGNLCRCTGYLKIYEAIEWAACCLRGENPPSPLTVPPSVTGPPSRPPPAGGRDGR